MAVLETLLLAASQWRLLIGIFFVNYFTRAVYRWAFHPLAEVPGPWLAGATSWWEVYWQVWRKGQLEFHLRELHKVYGPIIRIGPNSVHISDRDAYERIYHVGTPFGKDEWFYSVAFGPETFFTVPSNEDHRRLRGPLDPFFSRRNVLANMQPTVLDEAEKFTAELDKGTVMDMHRAFRYITTDVITRVAWGYDGEYIKAPPGAAEQTDALCSIPMAAWNRVYFPNFTRLLMLIPPETVAKMDAAFGAFFSLLQTCKKSAQTVKDETVAKAYKYDDHKTIYHALLDPETQTKGQPADVETITNVGFIIYGAAVEVSIFKKRL
jgi:hypothetical protein